jgi:hypothetical protein
MRGVWPHVRPGAPRPDHRDRAFHAEQRPAPRAMAMRIGYHAAMGSPVRLALALTGFALACTPAPPPPAATAPKPKAAPPAPSATATAEAPPEPAPKSVPARRIALDARGGCAVLEDGGVSCWGGPHATAPRRLEGIRDAVDVSLGGDLAVVRADGSVVAFADRDARVKAVALSIKGVRALSQALGSACALREGGKVSCWQGRVLDPITGAENRPAEVRGVSGAVAVSAAFGRGCLIQKDGGVACWTLGGPIPPKVVAGLANVVDLHVGSHVACARDTSRKVSCFELLPSPKAPVALGDADVLGFMEYQGDAPHVCQAREAGILCDRPKEFPASWTAPSLDTGEVPGSKGLAVKQLAVANHAACALDDKGIVRCFGLNFNGILGQPDSRRLEKATVVPDLPKMRSIAAGKWFSCALTVEGDVLCAGASGGASIVDKGPVTSKFQKVAGLPKVDRLHAHGEYACAFTAAGEAWCLKGSPWPGEARAPKRFPGLDGVRDVLMPGIIYPDVVAAIGASGELLVGAPPSLSELKLTTVPKFGPVRRVAVDPGDVVLAQDEKGTFATVWAPGGVPKHPIVHQDLAGALAINDHALVLLPGGKVRTVALHGQSAKVLAESSPLVTLLDGESPCGTTAAGVLGCLAGGDFRTIAEGVKQAAGSSDEQQLSLDAEGVLRCAGSNEVGQCGLMIGLFSSSTPIEVHLR